MTRYITIALNESALITHVQIPIRQHAHLILLAVELIFAGLTTKIAATQGWLPMICFCSDSRNAFAKTPEHTQPSSENHGTRRDPLSKVYIS